MKIFEKVFKGKIKTRQEIRKQQFWGLYIFINIFILFQVKVAMAHLENNKTNDIFVKSFHASLIKGIKLLMMTVSSSCNSGLFSFSDGV